MKKYGSYKKLLFGTVLFGFYHWQNNTISVTKLTLDNPKIPKEFDGFRILQVSDIQDKCFGKRQSYLLEKIKKLQPDCIVITGDLIDSNRLNLRTSMDFIKGAFSIAPTYYVSGNHEYYSGIYTELIECLKRNHVTVLENDRTILEHHGGKINLLGISDKKQLPNYRGKLKELTKGLKKNEFKILLSHRPEIFDAYAEAEIDLIFTGHAHGGQIRIPFLGGLFAPHQGFFPKYTNGLYQKEKSFMVVSRGLGNSVFPLRLFNRPNLVLMTLKNRT